MDEETILAALFAIVGEVRWTSPGDTAPDTRRFVTMSRRVKLFSDVSAEEQPACFQAEHGTTEGQVTNLPYKTILEANWIIYQSVGRDDKAVPARENNAIIRGIRQAIRPKPADPGFHDRRNTLGGLVYHCFISGRIFKDPGDIDGQGMLVVPIKLLVP